MERPDVTLISICTIVCALLCFVAYLGFDYNKTQIRLVSTAQTCASAVILAGIDVNVRLALCNLGKNTAETTKVQQ
jgi:hypothetical protein